jgi:hypothetical protein
MMMETMIINHLRCCLTEGDSSLCMIAWTSQPSTAKRDLQEHPGLLDRFWDLMNMEYHLAREADSIAKRKAEKKFMPAVKPGILYAL